MAVLVTLRFDDPHDADAFSRDLEHGSFYRMPYMSEGRVSVVGEVQGVDDPVPE
jgi:hypothetical protein